MSRLRMSRSRLAKLSHAQLLEFAVDACESSPELKNKADALIAEISPLPSWCVSWAWAVAGDMVCEVGGDGAPRCPSGILTTAILTMALLTMAMLTY
eukprot:scaffold47028_cov87-Phaeocystis_antarctica.AAC.4